MAKKVKNRFVCSGCGHTEAKWLGRCPSCGEWNTFSEQAAEPHTQSPGRPGPAVRPVPLSSVQVEHTERSSSGSKELDRVLGGGIIPGSAILIGGAPGIGKSTLMLQVAGAAGSRVLYVSGEESAGQIKMRSDRLIKDAGSIELLCDGSVENIERVLEKLQPDLVIIDSIQTLVSEEIGSVPGTVNQIKYCCHELISWVKERSCSLFLVAHVTKEGSIAGPKIIEHMVDTVLYFESAEGGLRILRGTKNRFGSVDEIGLFTMDAAGLRMVKDPSALFMVKRDGEIPAGMAPAPVYEGSRILMVEIQALTVPAKGAVSRISSDRIDTSRVARIAAVLEKHLNLRFSDQDIYINVAGGLRIQEVGIDLPIALALYSARTGLNLPRQLTAAGELSLAGEIREVAHLGRRCKTAEELGYTAFFGPRPPSSEKITLKGYSSVKNLGDAVTKCFGKST